jgi:hypothetical protein
MEVGKQAGPLRAKYCDKCNSLFTLANEELAVAEGAGTADSVDLDRNNGQRCLGDCG